MTYNYLLINEKEPFECRKCSPDFNNKLKDKVENSEDDDDKIALLIKEFRLFKSEIKQSLNFYNKKFEDFKTDITAIKRENKAIKKENISLKNEINSMRRTINHLDEERTRSRVVMRTEGNKSLTEVRNDIFKAAKSVNMCLQQNDVSNVSFIKKFQFKNGNVITHKSISLIEFANVQKKIEFMKNKQELNKLNERKTTFYDAIASNQIEIFNHAKNLKSIGYTVFSARGKIFAKKKNSEDSEILLKNRDAVDRLIEESKGLVAPGTRATRSKSAKKASTSEAEDEYNSVDDIEIDDDNSET
jgi:hypothetical protein